MEDAVQLDQLIEIGRVEEVDKSWVTYVFQKDYAQTPVVIATPYKSGNMDRYSVPRIRNVTTEGFELSVCTDSAIAWCDPDSFADYVDIVVFDRKKASALSWIDVGSVSVPVDGSPVSFTVP